jgi:hypothetical protein
MRPTTVAGREAQRDVFIDNVKAALSFEWQTTRQLAASFGYYESGSVAAVVKRLNIMRESGEIERLQEAGCETSWRKI